MAAWFPDVAAKFPAIAGKFTAVAALYSLLNKPYCFPPNAAALQHGYITYKSV